MLVIYLFMHDILTFQYLQVFFNRLQTTTQQSGQTSNKVQSLKGTNKTCYNFYQQSHHYFTYNI